MQRVRETYDPEKVNSVLLITDGKNEDENGIDLDTLLAELAKIDDPTKPVPVIMIGFGPDTDLAAMQQIAQATKGAAYSASKPEDLGTVLVDALSQRTLPPELRLTASAGSPPTEYDEGPGVAPGPSSCCGRRSRRQASAAYSAASARAVDVMSAGRRTKNAPTTATTERIAPTMNAVRRPDDWATSTVRRSPRATRCRRP